MSRVGSWASRALGSGVVALLLASVGTLACGPEESRASAASRQVRTSWAEPVRSVEAPTTTTTPPPAPKKVLIMGDSVIWDTVPGVTEGFRGAGIDVVSEAFPGTSLLGGTTVTRRSDA